MEQDKIEVDSSSDDCSSGYESWGYESSNESVKSSTAQYIYENGRRYHAYFGIDKNPQPTDEAEQDRLDLHHEIMLRLFHSQLHLAPLEAPRRILDIGTGTGIWCMDMADKYPMAEVIGTDLSPIQTKWTLPNCRFEVDDAELEWMHQPDSFDFIHARNIAQGIDNWPKLMSKIYRHTKPGSYAELAEIGYQVKSDDGTVSEDNAMKRIGDLLANAMKQVGRPWPVAGTLRRHLESAGFVDVQEVVFKQPAGPWPKEKRLKYIGSMVATMLETGAEGYCLATFTRVLGMDSQQVMRLCQEAVKAVNDRKTHMYHELFVAYGRKPEREMGENDK